jgi:hypothetical protein
VTRVCLHHVLWIGWLTVVFPSMPVMFALASYSRRRLCTVAALPGCCARGYAGSCLHFGL